MKKVLVVLMLVAGLSLAQGPLGTAAKAMQGAMNNSPQQFVEGFVTTLQDHPFPAHPDAGSARNFVITLFSNVPELAGIGLNDDNSDEIRRIKRLLDALATEESAALILADVKAKLVPKEPEVVE